MSACKYIVLASVFGLAEILVSPPRKVYVFIIENNIYRIKVLKNILYHFKSKSTRACCRCCPIASNSRAICHRTCFQYHLFPQRAFESYIIHSGLFVSFLKEYPKNEQCWISRTIAAGGVEGLDRFEEKSD